MPSTPRSERPAVTLPPTDTLAGSGVTGTNLQIVLLGMAGLLTVVLLVTPAGAIQSGPSAKS